MPGSMQHVQNNRSRIHPAQTHMNDTGHGTFTGGDDLAKKLNLINYGVSASYDAQQPNAQQQQQLNNFNRT